VHCHWHRVRDNNCRLKGIWSSVGNIGEGNIEPLAAFLHIVANEGHGDRFCGFAWPESKRAVGRNVIVACYGRAISRRIIHGGRTVEVSVAAHQYINDAGRLRHGRGVRKEVRRRWFIRDNIYPGWSDRRPGAGYVRELNPEELVELVQVVVDNSYDE